MSISSTYLSKPDVTNSPVASHSDVDVVTRIILKRGGIVNLTREIAKDPIAVYTKLKERRIKGGVNFSFPEIAEAIALLAKHMNGTRPSTESTEVWNSMRDSFYRELKKVCDLDFPYLFSLDFIHKHLESLHYYYLKIGSYKRFTLEDAEYPPDTMREYATFLNRINTDPSVIAFPTIENLSPGYFAKIQSVRAYPLAVSVAPTTEADGRKKSPTHMIVHDMQHIDDSEKAFLRTEGANEAEKMQRFQNNYLSIKNAFTTLKVKELWRACKLILFEASHEFRAVKFVPHNLKKRIQDDRFIPIITEKIQENQFAKIDATMIAFLEPAKVYLLELIDSGVLL